MHEHPHAGVLGNELKKNVTATNELYLKKWKSQFTKGTVCL